MDIGKIVFEEFNQWVYNDENQAGDKLQVIDASDLPEIIQNVVKKYNDIHNVSGSGIPIEETEAYQQGYTEGYSKAEHEATEEIEKNYTDNSKLTDGYHYR